VASISSWPHAASVSIQRYFSSNPRNLEDRCLFLLRDASSALAQVLFATHSNEASGTSAIGVTYMAAIAQALSFIIAFTMTSSNKYTNEGEQNGCRQRLEGYLSCQPRLPLAVA